MFTERERAFIQTQRLLRLATVAANGQPDADAVGFVFDGSVFIIGGHKLAQSRKYRNVHGGNHKVSLILDDLASVDPWMPRGIKVHGVAAAESRVGQFGPGDYLIVRPRSPGAGASRARAFAAGASSPLLSAQQPGAALRLLDWLAAAATARGYCVLAAQAAALQAIAYQMQHQSGQAHAALARALDLAAPRGLHQVVVEAGPELAPVLLQLLPRSPHAGFIQRLLVALQAERPAEPGAELREQLTGRELLILRLLGAGLNSTEIAAQLVLAPSTVRSYIKSLYSKLQVNRRFEALARARDLQML